MVKKFYVRWGVPGAILAIISLIVWESVKDAVVGWANSKIAEIFDMPDFSLQQAYPILTAYLPPVFLVLAAFATVWWAYKIGQKRAPQTAEKVFINAPRSSGLRLIGNFFRGGRKHVEASDAKDFHAVGNVHIGSGKKSARMPLLELRDKATELGWDFYSGHSLHILDFIHGLRQAAKDGDIVFWGRLDRNKLEFLTKDEIFQEIPGDHFINFNIEITGLSNPIVGGPIPADNFNVITLPKDPTSNEKGFRDLHIDRDSAMRWLSNEADQYKGHTKRY